MTNNKYSQMEKNTVDSSNQLKLANSVFAENPDGCGKRIMFVGNSITLHGVKEEIGWHNHWGMAASSKEKDYVHILINAINQKTEDAAYCICQVAGWEREYKNGGEVLKNYKAARDFNADIIIMRFIENCPARDFEPDTYKTALAGILSYLNPEGKAKIVMTTGFWRHPGDEKTTEYASENNLPLVTLGDLGDRDDMKAIGLFEHSGVANHPGDAGMKVMADRIMKEVEKLL